MAGSPLVLLLQSKRPAGPWLVSSLVPLNLFEPRIAKRFEAGAEEDRAVAQALKLGCRLAPPSHLRLVKPNRIQRKIYRRKSAHTSMSPTPGVLEKPDASKERPINQNEKTKGNQKMKPICWMRPLLPILFALISLLHGNHRLWKWRSSKPWCGAGKSSPSCCRRKRTAWKESLPMCAPL